MDAVTFKAGTVWFGTQISQPRGLLVVLLRRKKTWRVGGDCRGAVRQGLMVGGRSWKSWRRRTVAIVRRGGPPSQDLCWLGVRAASPPPSQLRAPLEVFDPARPIAIGSLAEVQKKEGAGHRGFGGSISISAGPFGFPPRHTLQSRLRQNQHRRRDPSRLWGPTMFSKGCRADFLSRHGKVKNSDGFRRQEDDTRRGCSN